MRREARANREHSSVLPNPLQRCFGYAPLLIIIVLAFGLRLLCIILFTGAIDSEGAEYARIAENLLSGKGYEGIATPGMQLFFPPLFPYLIAAFSLLTHQTELAGRLVSLIMGTMLVLPVYFIGLRLYGRVSAYVAAALIAFHPYLIFYSSTVYCEPTNITLVLAGIYWSLKAFRARTGWSFLLSGVFFGLAYLIRPEAAIYMFVAFAFMITYVFITKSPDRCRVMLRSICMPAMFMLLASPYIIWLHAETGRWQLENKSPLNNTLSEYILEGSSIEEAGHRIDTDLTERGVWIQPNLAIIQSYEFSIRLLGRLLLGKAKGVFIYLLDTIVGRWTFGSPMLFALSVLGLFCIPWRREHAANQLFLFLILGIASSGLFFIYYFADRFLLIFLPFLIVWASNGIMKLARWTSSTMRLVFGRVPHHPRFEVAFVFITTAIVPLITLPSVHGRLTDMKHSRSLKIAGEWLNTYAPGPKNVMDVSTIVSFHASATFVPFPYCDSSVALRYIDKRKVNFIVIHEQDPTSRPYLKDWVENGIPSSRAKEIYTTSATRAERIIIYEWNSGQDGDGVTCVGRSGSRVASIGLP
jgi:4-amino-4-deoxy-L-arabinose transferase-like glycosyltransferase